MIENAEKKLECILQSKELPTLPVVATKLLALTAEEETTLSDIARLITQDVALSSKVLRVSNSAFYSFPQKIGTINQAVSILGTNAVRSLVLSFSFFSLTGKGKKRSRFDFKLFWEKSLVNAVASKLILEQLEGADTEEIFISGLLQNIGKLIFATTLPEEYDQVLELLEQQKDSDEEAVEEAILGISHQTAGYEIAKKWGFPDSLLLPIKYHHTPDEFRSAEKRLTQNIQAVYLADLLTSLYYKEEPEEFHKRFRKDAAKKLGLNNAAINKILKELDREIGKAAEYFDVKLNKIKSVSEILQEANIRLSLLNLSYEEMNRELVAAKMALEKITEELAQKNTLLENLANIDGLTEISNHRFFQNFLDKEINRSIRNQGVLSLLLADIDHFKQVNDNYGHQIGDFILKEFCRVAKENIREYDLIARYGGEEFVFVLPETEPEEAMVVAEKLRKLIEEYAFSDGENTYNVTVSIGVAGARPVDNSFKKNEFIGLADEALYQAKENGRNRVALYSPKKKKWFKF